MVQHFADRDVDVKGCRASAYAHLVRLDAHLISLREAAVAERPGTPRSVLRTLRKAAEGALGDRVQEMRARTRRPGGMPQFMFGRNTSPRVRDRMAHPLAKPKQPRSGLKHWVPAGRHCAVPLGQRQRSDPVVDDSPRAAAAREEPLSPRYEMEAEKSPAAARQPEAAADKAGFEPPELASQSAGTFHRAMLEFPPLVGRVRRRRLVDSYAASPPASPRSGDASPAGPTEASLSPRAGEVTAQPRRGLRALCCGRFAPTGDKVASAGRDRAVRIWQIRTGLRQPQLDGHRGWVLSIAWSPCGKLLASAGDDCTISIWKVDDEPRTPVKLLTGHAYAIWSVAWHPTNMVIASGSADGGCKLWDPASGCETGELRGHSSAVYSVCFGGFTGGLLCTAGRDGQAVVWDWAKRRVRCRLSHNRAIVWGAAFGRRGRLLATACADGSARVWRVADQVCVRVFPGPKEGVRRAVFSDSGEHLLVCQSDVVNVWPLRLDDREVTDDLVEEDGSTGALQPEAELRAPTGVKLQDIDLRGSFVLGAGSDGVIRVWTCPLLGDAPEWWSQEDANRDELGMSSPTGKRKPLPWTGGATWGKEGARVNHSLPSSRPLAQQLSEAAYVRLAELPNLLNELRSRCVATRPPTQIELLKFICKVVDELLLRAQGSA
eukprot:Hpha_TRINITY_DN29821_c0_g1::TRINITY_DN29821_c0_g1_i1::g.2910::m.2910